MESQAGKPFLLLLRLGKQKGKPFSKIQSHEKSVKPPPNCLFFVLHKDGHEERHTVIKLYQQGANLFLCPMAQ